MNRLALALSLTALVGCKTGDMLRASQAQNAQYEQELKEQEARSAKMKADLAQKQAEIDKKQAELEKKQADIAAADARLKELQAAKQELEATKTELAKKSSEYEQLQASLKSEIEAGRVELTELRGKMTVKMKDKILFSSGSAAVGKDGKAALQAVADALKDVKGKTIRVEGHTDNIPTRGSGFASNWDLSTARALAVVRFLQSAGVDPGKLAAAGYGEYQPISENETPEGRSLNRRIEIVLAAAAAR